jgi:hypothetical protein
MSLSKIAAVAFRCSLAVACLVAGDYWAAWTVLAPVGHADDGEDES